MRLAGDDLLDLRDARTLRVDVVGGDAALPHHDDPVYHLKDVMKVMRDDRSGFVMIFTGDPVEAEAALAWGLVSEIVPLADLHARPEDLARTIASRAPVAARMAKDNLRSAYALSREDAIRCERDLQTICFATEDAAEGRRAFAEKRPPAFTGR